MTSAAVEGTTAPATKPWSVTLWIVQVVLALAFGAIGLMKLSAAAEDLAKMGTLPVAMIRFIGACELAGALGLLLPAITRIKPWLTVAAAIGLTTVMVLAAGYHVLHAEYAHMLAPLALGVLTAFVAWGRLRKAPIRGR